MSSVTKRHLNTSMFKAALYYMDLDTIEYEGKGTSSNPYVTRNMSFKNKGLEMTYEKDFGSKYSYSLGANFCNPMGKNKKGVWERNFAREQYNAGIKYHDAKFNAALTGMFTTDRASGWGDLLPVNFIAGYKFDKSSSVELGVENIFDRDDIVSNPGSATKYYCLPRMVHVTYTYTF
jgi:outer membrane cobalamin receptor